jgi:23S rRNA-/tRNA-specific pseudouridylate synthase
MQFQVIHETPDLLVIDKSAGLLSQRDDSEDASLVDEAKTYLKSDFVGLVHRLDRNTSGLMVLAKNPRSAKSLTQQIQSGKLLRHYDALLWGELPPEFSWSHHLEKNPKKNHVTVFRRPSPKSKEAHLKGHRSALFAAREIPDSKISLVEIELETGRSHQIRAQAAFEGHPVLGDHRYGAKLPLELKSLSRPALHSCYLGLQDTKGVRLEFRSPIDLTQFPQVLRK